MLHLQKHSYNYPLLAYAMLHVLMTSGVTLLSAELIAMAFNATFKWAELYMIAWVMICGTAGRWFVAVSSLFLHRRRPIREESEILSLAILEMEARTGRPVVADIFMEDSKIINASASGIKTWSISTGALQKLDTLEIAAVLAHEQGHHRSGDTRMRAAMIVCYWVNNLLAMPGNKIIRVIKHGTLFAWILCLIIIPVMVLLNIYQPLCMMMALLLPCLCSGILYKILRPLDLFITRQTEYKQDAYAASLGLGPALRSVCLKLAKQYTPEKNSWWYVTFHRTHPIVHNRIRRLDALNDLSANFSES